MTLGQSLFHRLHADRIAAYASLPGPTPSSPLGNAGDFLGAKPWEVLLRYATAHGGMLVFWFTSDPVVLVSDAAALDQVFVSDVPAFYKKAPIPALEPVLGTAVNFMSPDRESWLRATPPTVLTTVVRREGHAWLGAQVEVIRDQVERGLGALAAAGEVDASEAVRRLGFDVFARMIFGRTLTSDHYEDFVAMATAGDHRITGVPYPAWMPSFSRAKERWLAAMRAQIAAARAAPDPEARDLLQTALRTGNPQTDEELASDLSNVFFGGLFSSATSVVSVLHELTRRPAIAAEFAAEIGVRGLGWPAIAASGLLERALRETLRLRPPVPIFMRNVSEARPATLGGHALPAGTTLYLSSYVCHHDPARWADPGSWEPARWTEAVLRDNPWGSASFWPFGRGERTCTGDGMALVFIKTTLATILAASAPAVGAGQTYDGELFFATMRPKGMKARFPARG